MSKRFLRLGGVLVALFFLLALVGPWLSPFAHDAQDLGAQFAGPSSTHWLGTGDNGVDLLSALLGGARTAALIGLSVVSITAIVGTLLGTIAGLYGGKLDMLFTFASDTMQAFPGIVLHVAVLALVAKPGIFHMVLALSVSGWVVYGRVARAQALSLRSRDYVVAARALGMKESRVILKHVAPNLIGPIIVQATAAFGGIVLAESTLSFLGLGPSGTPSWGALLSEGGAVLLRFPHIALIAGLSIGMTVFAFNRFGDELSDTLDPRS